jgi:hypothetical protein
MRDGLIETLEAGPLCPGSFPPAHPSHAARNVVLNAVYTASPKNDDIEIQPESAATAYSAAAYGVDARGGDRMRLYRDTAQPVAAPLSYIQAWYFRCSVCGLILPAGEVTR